MIQRIKWIFMALLTAGLFFALQATHASAGEWKDEVNIKAFCHDLETVKEIFKMEDELSAGEFNMWSRSLIKSKKCLAPVHYGFLVAFRPKEEVWRDDNFNDMAMVVIKGNLIKDDSTEGKVVFVIVALQSIDYFKSASAEKIRYQDV